MIYPVSSKCNQKCIFCSAYRREDFFDIELFKKKVAQSRDNLVVISGGEPLLLGPRVIIYLVNFCVENLKTVEIQTNATPLVNWNGCDITMLSKVMKKTNGYFNVNLPSNSKYIDFKITGLRYGFKKRIDALKLMKEKDITVRITHVINKINYRYLDEFALFLIDHKNLFNMVQFSFIKAMGKAEKNKKIVPRYRDVGPYIVKAFEKLERAGIEFWVDHIPLCFLGDFYTRHVDVYKMKNKIKAEYLIEKKKLSSCRGCRFYRICSGPRIDYIDIYGSL